MAEVVLGRYATPQYVGGPTFFGSNAFWAADYGVLGVASSLHHYHLAPIAERDIQAAFGIVRASLNKIDPAERSGIALLKGLLKAVHRGFVEIDIRTHIAGIEFESTGLPGFPEPANDPESEPRVFMALLQIHKQRLSIVSAGNFLVYLVRPTEQKLIFGWDWFSNTQAAGVDFFAPPVYAYSDVPKICSCETEVRPGDLIIATTHILGEIIVLARFDQLVCTTGCDPEAVNHHLMVTLKSIVPEGVIDLEEPHGTTKSFISEWGAAWAITCVEEQDGVDRQ